MANKWASIRVKYYCVVLKLKVTTETLITLLNVLVETLHHV
jgi:hypothetical protein